MSPAARARRRTSASIGDVARLAGVSSQTVSRVSTGSEKVAEATRVRVLTAMDQLGYSPNRAARALRTGTFGSIGVMAQSFEKTGEALITTSVVEAARDEGYSVVLINVGSSDTSSWQDHARRLAHMAIDGLVIVRADPELTENLSLPAMLPVVVTGSIFGGRYPAATVDQLGGTTAAVQHLLDLGHRTVHHIAGPDDSESAVVRRKAWSTALTDAGAPVVDPVFGDWSAQGGHQLGQRLVEDESITAVYCANDETAFGLIRAAHEAGRRVPDDLSVVGYDDIALAEFSSPPLTTVRAPFARIGHELVRLLMEQLRLHDGHAANERIEPRWRATLPTELVVRASTAPPRSR